MATKKIAVLGSKKSGKTSIVEILVRHFTEMGLIVGTIKHIHHPNFTIDSEGSDTWRHRRAGAKATAYLSPLEAGLILSMEREPENLEEALRLIEGLKMDLLIMEGFHRLVAKRFDVGKIIAFKDFKDLEERIKGTEQPIIAYCTFNEKLVEEGRHDIDYMVLPRDKDKLVHAVSAFMWSQ
ncbi:MAG: molybdopterin-guanine dinucleotide biosynthesis protein B [Candidatus Nezhaarchaeota archaeon]|nr:molybdopterin-guanine dinucleotide biosynthesis protein B [Candidatus Nezhaarchaeota archaeon]